VRANADVPRDAQKARALAPKGSASAAPNTCFAQDRLAHVVAMIMAAHAPEVERRLSAGEAAGRRTRPSEVAEARDPRGQAQLTEPRKAYRGSLAKLLPFQRGDFRGLFRR
jgi:hypothetical protein